MQEMGKLLSKKIHFPVTVLIYMTLFSNYNSTLNKNICENVPFITLTFLRHKCKDTVHLTQQFIARSHFK